MLFGGLAGLLLIAGTGYALRPREPATVEVGGVRLTYPEYAWFTANRAQLGEPVWKRPVEARSCLGFTFFVGCHRAQPEARGTRDEWEILDLGRRDALRRGVPLRPGAPAHPAVQAYIEDLERQGVAWRSFLGLFPISDALCIVGGSVASGPGECVQFFPNQTLRFSQDGGPVATVRLTPLGAELPPR